MAKENTKQSNGSGAEAIGFEVWFTLRSDKIPKHHYREILKADFNSQGVPAKATMAQWDAALKRYGVALG
jgi:hypothetical protein